MSAFVIYLIKSALLLSMGVTLFMLLMKRETFHRFNRWLLLLVVAMSLVVPTIEFSFDSPMAFFSQIIEEAVVGGAGPVSDIQISFAEPVVATLSADEAQPEDFTLWQHLSQLETIDWVVVVYFMVALFLIVRLFYMYARVVAILRSGLRVDSALYNMSNNVRMVVHNADYKPFSWFGWVSISRTDLAECGREILTHEAAHVKCKHSYDILFADLVIILQWFNPMAWVMKNLLKDIHEYEADSAVLAAGVDAKSYQLLIIKKAVGARLYSIANSFNHSLTKKRITMMCKEKSSLWQCTKALYVLPLAVVAACTFSSPNNATDDKGSEKVVNQETSASNLPEVVMDANPKENASDAVQCVQVVAYGKKSNEQVKVYEVVEQLPEFVGGTGELMQFLCRNIKYPKESRDKNSQGKCLVSFVVDKNGGIYDVKVAKTSGDNLLDAEAVRVVKTMPAWKPGKQGGKAVDVRFTLPVVFRLQGPNAPASPSMNNTSDNNNALPDVQVVTYGNENKERVYQVVEQQPEYPGGMAELMRFLSRNTKYPDECRKNNIQGKSYIGFIVDKNGTIRDVSVVKTSGNDLLDAEAIRVVKSMPAWNPGKQKGEAVNVRYTLPVFFRLQ